MTLGQGIALGFAALWIAGWGFTIRDTGSPPDATRFQRIAGSVVLFFVWPYIAWAMATSRH